MNLNLNFGEHFYEAGNSTLFYDLGITFISAFLGFLAALLINRQVDKRDLAKEIKRKELKYLSHLRYLSQILDSILKSYPKQAKNFSELAIAVKEKPLETQMPYLQATYDLSRLKDMDCSELRDAYFYSFTANNESIESYRKLFTNADFLLMYFDDLLKQNENHRNFTHKDQMFVRDCIEETHLRLSHREISIEKKDTNLSKENREYQFLKKFNGQFLVLTKTETSFQDVLELYIQPLQKSILSEIHDEEFAHEIYILLRKAAGRLRYIEFNSLSFAKNMGTVETRINETINYLTEFNLNLKEKTNSARKDLLS